MTARNSSGAKPIETRTARPRASTTSIDAGADPNDASGAAGGFATTLAKCNATLGASLLETPRRFSVDAHHVSVDPFHPRGSANASAVCPLARHADTRFAHSISVAMPGTSGAVI